MRLLGSGGGSQLASSTNYEFAVHSCLGCCHTVSQWHIQDISELFSFNHDSLNFCRNLMRVILGTGHS
jgi:hypothetical protein